MQDSVHRTNTPKFKLHLLTFAAVFSASPALAGNTTDRATNPPDASSEAAAGLLTPFEARRHSTFVETARSAPIDLLFLGDSSVEFWLAEGKAEWGRHYAPLRAANFGVQGSDTKSLLWRLQQGELDRFEAKVVVIDALWAGDLTNGASEAEILAGNSAIVAEVRKRQPQAKVLLLVVPRMRGASIQAALADHFAHLAADPAIEFVDVERPFLSRDGRFDTAMGSGRGSALSPKGYATLAQSIEG